MKPNNKYQRTVIDISDHKNVVIADVYSVLKAFRVTCPARQHAIKKLLCAGLRGKGDTLQDLQEAAMAVDRAIELQFQDDKRKAE